MLDIIDEILDCKICEAHLPLGCNPVLQAHSSSKILIVGQAPGIHVHRTNIPWNDKSGDNLRKWMNIDKELFYNVEQISIIPMGFCYPGTGKTGDLPPRKECAETWHNLLLEKLPNLELILLVGKYAQDYYLKGKKKKNLTETVKAYQEYLPKFFPLPHPSPRNNIWMKKNSWFKEEVIPVLKNKVGKNI